MVVFWDYGRDQFNTLSYDKREDGGKVSIIISYSEREKVRLTIYNID